MVCLASEYFRIGFDERVLSLLGDVDKALIRQERSETGHLQVISGNGEAQILGVELLDEAGQPTAAVETGSRAVLLVRARARQALAQLVVGFLIRALS